MSEPKHTPGPWEVAYRGSRPVVEATEKRRGMRCAGDKYPLICTMPDAYSDTQANACLVAAAPALLEALEEVDSELAVWQECEELTNGVVALRAEIKDALKLARGEE